MRPRRRATDCMKLLGKLLRAPSVLTSDRYALAQVALYIFALSLGVIGALQIVAAFVTPASQIPVGGHRLALYAAPAMQNFFMATGMVFLSLKLHDDQASLAWGFSVGVMLLQIVMTILGLCVQGNLISVMALALAIFGLGSLFAGREVLEERQASSHNAQE